MGAMKTPGVYIVEKNAFPNSVVEVATAVPAFIGYTEKADNNNKPLNNKPWRITSMSEYRKYFGGAPEATFKLAELADAAAPATSDWNKLPSLNSPTFNLRGKSYQLTQDKGKFMLYYSMMLFFQNGGGPCYIVSVGDYSEPIDVTKLTAGIEPLTKEQEPTMVIIPDAVLTDGASCISLQQASMKHCAERMKNRVAVLDVWGGFRERQSPDGDCIDNFRNALGINYLDFSMAYYPWVNTTIVKNNQVTYANFADPAPLQAIMKEELGIGDAASPEGDDAKAKAPPSPAEKAAAQKKKIISDEIAKIPADPTQPLKPEDASQLDKTLRGISNDYVSILDEITNSLNLLPPAAGMAGIFTMVDNSHGVWKAPANVSLNSVIAPEVNITHEEQEDLNVPIQGKAVNAIRAFIGEGTLVWGARTLDGNSLDWRYIQVRRTIIMLEESIRLATKAYVFENNVATTWVTIKSMIENFLTGIWKRGGLAGSSPEDAFNVSVGLGETMTAQDILDGILRVTVLVALVRPAEFIEITFQQQMQKS